MLRLYAPVSISRLLSEVVATALPCLRLVTCSLIPRLDAGDLRCFNILIAGTSRHLRAPVAFPFIPEDSEILDLLDDIDWIYLGGDPDKFIAALARWTERRGQGEAAFIPFVDLTGSLSRDARPGEPRLAVKLTHANYNQPEWVRCKDAFRTTPEQDWPSLGAANTRDAVEHFGPWLTRIRRDPPPLILDLGCGLGQSARSLAVMFPGSKVVGLDVSEEAIDVARTVFQFPNLSYQVHGFDDPLPFSDQSAGLIVSINALPYAADQMATARDIFRVLSPDGLFLNYCRLLLSQLALNFPACLLWAHDHQLDPGDWTASALQSHFQIALSQGLVSGISPDFFICAKLPEFKDKYATLADATLNFSGYRPWHSHAMMIAAKEPALGEPLPEMPCGHLDKLGYMLAAVSGESPEARELALLSWRGVAEACKLLPEAYAFMAACLPDQAWAPRALHST
jgi:SAM-dependent methyltransferase